MNIPSYISRSDKESNRFGLEVFRGNILSGHDETVSKLVSEGIIDLAILRIPINMMEGHVPLDSRGLRWLVADTLFYYTVDLKSYIPKELQNASLDITTAIIDDVPAVENLVKKTFDGYKNHYMSNPFLSKEKILEGYVEWTLDFIDKKDKRCFVVSVAGENIGFATCSINRQFKEGELVLFGVVKDAFLKYKMTGIYADMIRFCQKWCKGNGCNTVITSTQSWNKVKSVWESEGFLFSRAVHTVHVYDEKRLVVKRINF